MSPKPAARMKDDTRNGATARALRGEREERSVAAVGRVGVVEGGLEELLYGYYLWLFAFLLLLAVAVVSASAGRRTSRTPTADKPS